MLIIIRPLVLLSLSSRVSRYECTATSNNGEATAAGQLIVKSKTTIIDGPVDRTETLDDTIVMKCEVVADLSLHLDVTWKKDNLDLGQPGFEKNERIHQDEDHSLTIKNLTFEDSGGNVFLFYTFLLCCPSLLKGFIRNSKRIIKKSKFRQTVSSLHLNTKVDNHKYPNIIVICLVFY